MGILQTNAEVKTLADNSEESTPHERLEEVERLGLALLQGRTQAVDQNRAMEHRYARKTSQTRPAIAQPLTCLQGFLLPEISKREKAAPNELAHRSFCGKHYQRAQEAERPTVQAFWP